VSRFRLRGFAVPRMVVAAVLAVAGSALWLTAPVAPASAAVAPAGAAPAVTSPAVLSGLACRTLSDCVAVGENTPTMPSQLIGNQWNGKHWSRVAMPKPAGSVNVSVGGVACPAARECVTVGQAYPKSGDYYAIAEYWNGSRWTVGKAAAPGSSSELMAVSCANPSSCFAVGEYTLKGKLSFTVLIEHWNGKGWTQLAAPVPHGTSYGSLYDVSCATKSFCVAVGSDSAGELVERWNGKTWTATTPPSSTSSGTLWGVSCPATTSCYAVGGDQVGTGAVVERWNGKKWSYAAAPVPKGSQSPWLQDVSCVSATSCLAVGDELTSQVFSDRWNGKSWKPVSMSASGGHLGYLVEVRCLTATSCVALGSVSSVSAAWRSESAFWNGKSWKVVLTA
jgi:hypothetical protein